MCTVCLLCHFISILNMSSSLLLGLEWTYNFLTCGIRNWFRNLGSEIIPRSSNSCESKIFIVVLKEWKLSQEQRSKNSMARILSFGILKLKISL
jgi:hypothetical protein